MPENEANLSASVTLIFATRYAFAMMWFLHCGFAVPGFAVPGFAVPGFAVPGFAVPDSDDRYHARAGG
jgi:hypothetical protein